MPALVVSAIGRDRPGIVAALSGVLLEHGASVEDTQATILRGHFSIVLIVAVPEHAERERLSADLARAGEDLGLEAIVLQDVDELDPVPPTPSHLVTVYGVDRPGILHGTARALAERGVGITDLNARMVEDEGEETLDALMMEVAAPYGASAEELQATLEGLREAEGLQVSVRELERDEL